MYWIMYEVIIFLSEPIDSLNAVIHLSIYCDNHDTHWIQSFLHLQTWPVLQQKIHCCFHTPHLKQPCNRFSNVSCGFSSCLMTHFTIFPWLNQNIVTVATVCDGLLMFFLHFVSKLLSNLWEHHITTMLSEVFCFWLLTWKYQLVHPFLTDVNIAFLWILWLIHRFRFWNKPYQLTLLSVIFLAIKVLYNISRLCGLAIFQCSADFLGTCPKPFINSHHAQFNCIKGKWHDRRHLCYNFGPRQG